MESDPFCRQSRRLVAQESKPRLGQIGLVRVSARTFEHHQSQTLSVRAEMTEPGVGVGAGDASEMCTFLKKFSLR